MAPPRGKFQTKLNAVMYSMMLEELLSGPCTAKGLADYTGMSILTVHRTMRVMHRRGVIHIASWEQDTRNAWTLKAWALGHGKDAKKPKPGSSGGKWKAKQRDLMVHAALAGVARPMPAANNEREAA